MKKITGWAFAAAVVGMLIAGCTVESTTDTGEGGTSPTTTGMAGSAAGAGGSAAGAGGGGGTGGSADTDSGTPVVMGACEKCAATKCKMDYDACVADKGGMGCGMVDDAFYACLSKPNADDTACATQFASDANAMGMSQGLVNDIAGCVTDSDPAKGCLAECGGGASDAGKGD